MYTSSSIPNSYLGKCTYILVKFYRNVGQLGRPLALGERSCTFKSCHSDLQEFFCNVHSLKGQLYPLRHLNQALVVEQADTQDSKSCSREYGFNSHQVHLGLATFKIRLMITENICTFRYNVIERCSGEEYLVSFITEVREY